MGYSILNTCAQVTRFKAPLKSPSLTHELCSPGTPLLILSIGDSDILSFNGIAMYITAFDSWRQAQQSPVKSIKICGAVVE